MINFRTGLVTLMLTFAWVSMPAMASPADELRQYVDRNIQQMVDKLNAEKGLYSEDPEAFYQSMEEELSNFVDFRRIAARVMGRYARQTTPEQRDEFVRKFKRSLFDQYAQVVVSAEGFEIDVKQATINPNDDSRASVDMEVISASGERYQITYSMYQNNDGRWLMENIIAEGINIGIGFRDVFSQEMEKRQGNIQAVIENWGTAIESMNLEQEADNS